MISLNLLQHLRNRCKISLQVAGLEPAICVSIVQLTAECVYQFRHTCKSKIHNGSIKLVSAQRETFSIFQFQTVDFSMLQFYQ